MERPSIKPREDKEVAIFPSPPPERKQHCGSKGAFSKMKSRRFHHSGGEESAPL